MLKDEIEIQLKNDKKNDSNQPESTYQTCSLSYQIEITI
jgi:hypothetical protein